MEKGRERGKKVIRKKQQQRRGKCRNPRTLFYPNPIVWILSLTRTPIRYQYHQFPVKIGHIELPREMVGGGTDLLTSCFHVNGLLTPTEEEFCIALVGEKSVILMVLHISKEFVSLLTPLPTGDRNPA